MSFDKSEYDGEKANSVEHSRLRAWTYVGSMMVVILITLPITPILWRAATKVFGPEFNAIGYVVFFLAFIGFGIYMFLRRSKFDAVGLVSLIGFALVYYYLLRYHCQFPAERLHLLEYGLLAYLLYRAFRMNFPKAGAYALGFLIASGFGFLDEAIQYILPNRVFEMRDVMTNVFAAGVGLLAVAVLLRPDSARLPLHEADK